MSKYSFIFHLQAATPNRLFAALLTKRQIPKTKKTLDVSTERFSKQLYS